MKLLILNVLWFLLNALHNEAFLSIQSQRRQYRYNTKAIIHHDRAGVSVLLNMISSGFRYTDGHQILISLQKPLGLVLEEFVSTDGVQMAKVVEVDPNGTAGRNGVFVGDVVLAVQNMEMVGRPLEDVLAAIYNAPKVVNLRLLRDMMIDE